MQFVEGLQTPENGAAEFFVQYIVRVEVVLLIIFFILAFIMICAGENRKRKICAVIAFGYICLFVIFCFIFSIVYKRVQKDASFQDSFFSFLDSLESSWNGVVAGILIRVLPVLLLVSVILLLILLARAKSKSLLKDYALTFLQAFVVYPFTLLVIENIANLIWIILSIGLALGIIKVMFADKRVKENSEESNRTNEYSEKVKQEQVSTTPSYTNNKDDDKKEKIEESPAQKTIKKGSPYREGKNVYIPKYGKGGYRLYREKGGMDRVYWIYDRWSGSPNNICEYSALKSGAIHIYEAETGREIKCTEIGYAPEK